MRNSVKDDDDDHDNGKKTATINAQHPSNASEGTEKKDRFGK